ncbi:hypothetical protein AB6831_04095 [Carnobacterium divergens]|uniref:hypothetical protein n=1 Tax=Carnobacterium divergens TaxID=2748 RepID=UPI0039C93808
MDYLKDTDEHLLKLEKLKAEYVRLTDFHESMKSRSADDIEIGLGTNRAGRFHTVRLGKDLGIEHLYQTISVVVAAALDTRKNELEQELDKLIGGTKQ